MMDASLDLGLTKNPIRLRWIDTLAFLLPLSMYLALPALLVNGDGLSYYNLVLHGDWKSEFLFPGHLLYCPLMTVLGGAASAIHLSGVLQTMLLSDQLAGAASTYLLFRIAHRLGINRFGQWMAALGLAFSYGFWREASDVKTYVLALLFVLASIGQMIRYAESRDPRGLVSLGALNSAAGLFHLTLISIVTASLCLIVWVNRGAPRRLAQAVGVFTGSVALFFALPVFLIGSWTFHAKTGGEILAWLKLSGHGYRVVLDVLSIPRALYGFARTFVYFEFFWGAPKWSIILKGLGFVAAGVWATWGIRSTWGRLSPTTKTVLGSLSAYVLLQVAFGVYFFPSDTERWIFIAPVVWLVLAAHVSLQKLPQRRIAALGVGLMFTINLAQAIWPAATDASTKARVLALDSLLPAQALLIAPGGDWMDYYDYFTSKHMDRMVLIGQAKWYQDDHAAFYRELEQRIAEAREAKRPVVMIRILDPSENYKSTPWQELEALGYPTERIRSRVQRYPWEERRLGDPERTRTYWLR